MLGTNSNASIVTTAGDDASGFAHNPEERAKQIFQKMDTNKDAILDEKEFIEGCLNDKSLMQMLTSTGKAR